MKFLFKKIHIHSQALKALVYSVKCRCFVTTWYRTVVPELAHASPGGHLNKIHGEAQAEMQDDQNIK